jgi:hypothetical protein
MSELEKPDAVERSAGDEPCGRTQLEVSVEQWRKGTGGSIDVLQEATVIDWDNGKLNEHRLDEPYI